MVKKPDNSITPRNGVMGDSAMNDGAMGAGIDAATTPDDAMDVTAICDGVIDGARIKNTASKNDTDHNAIDCPTLQSDCGAGETPHKNPKTKNKDKNKDTTSPPIMNADISCRDVGFSYTNAPCLYNTNFDIPAHTMTAIVGPNGGGKSTLLNLIKGVLKPKTGRIQTSPHKTIGYMPQSWMVDRTFPIHVFDVVSMGLPNSAHLFGGVTSSQKECVSKALKSVGLDGFENRHISQLSGGQFQRVLFARLCVENADIILLDEPFAAVDKSTTHDMIQLLTSWQNDGKTIVCVTHDLDLVRRHFDHMMIISKTVITHDETQLVLGQNAVLNTSFLQSQKWDTP